MCLFSSWSYSNKGKSTTQTKLKEVLSTRPSLLASSRRSSDNAWWTMAPLSATKKRISFSSAPSSLLIDSRSSSVKNLVMGDCHSPAAFTLTQASPLAPNCPTYSVRTSSSLREKSPHPLALTLFTSPPFLTTDLKTLKPQSLTVSVRSISSRPNLVSGLSVPKRAIASS